MPDFKKAKRQRLIDGVSAVAAVFVLVTGLGRQFWAWSGNLFDDAYIYLRYAENILNGCGLRWNCDGLVVEGFTSPLYLAMLTFLGALNVDLESAATAIGFATWGLALVGFVLLPFLVRRSVPEFPATAVALLMAVALASDQLIAINAASGMEGGIVSVVLVVVAALAWRPRVLAVVAPALVLARPELGLATLLQPVLGRDHLRRAVVAGAVVFGVITAARLVLFHDVLPNTFWAKSGGSADHLAAGAQYLWTSYSRFPLAALVVLGFFSRLPPLRYLASIVVVWSLYFLWSGGDFYLQARLFAYLAPLAYFVAIAGLLELLNRTVTSTAQCSALAFTVVLGLVWTGAGWRDSYNAENGFANVQRWADTGRYLRRCLRGASVAAVPIGAIAYYSKAPVHDLVGLVDPRLAIAGKRATGADFVVGHERYDGAWSLSREPQVVFFEVHSSEPIDSSQRLDLAFLAERDLLDEIRDTRAPYVAVSPQVSQGVYQFLLVRRDIAEAASARARSDCF